MLIEGEWYPCDDGAIRPVLLGEVLKVDGSWLKLPFLVVSGADRTVFSADILTELALPSSQATDQLGGVGGAVSTVVVDTQIRMTHERNGKVLFRGQFAGFLDREALDMSVLGRDLLNLFALIVDRPNQFVYLLREQHTYTLVEK